jgi:nucleotide sugar dehydrogenase
VKLCVVALGKIGLPLAVQAASRGIQVYGADIDEDAVRSINAGVPPFPGEAHLDERLATAVRDGLLAATTDTAAAVAASDVVLVVVPLVVDDEARPDFRALDAANASIAAGLRAGTLVVYETTVPVGSTRTRFAPALAEASGLSIDDFLVAYSPERVYSGRIFDDLRKYPKLVGGLTPAATVRAIEFYEAMLEFDERDDLARPNGVWDLGSVEASEFAKVAETTYRDVNIGLANQFARFADGIGIDVHAVIEASNSQPFSHIHTPGIAVGGHCIPVYPRFYLANDPSAHVVSEARAVNEDMPRYAVEKLVGLLGESLDGRRVAVLGAAYRGGVKETAFSGVFGVVEALRARGAVPVVHDPLYSDAELSELGFDPYHIGEPCDALIVQADHVGYRDLVPSDVPGVRCVVDGRGILDPAAWTTVAVGSIGRPSRAPNLR